MWISVDDKLPEIGEKSIARDENNNFLMAFRNRCGDWLMDLPHGPRVSYTPEITHWMPIPEFEEKE